MQAPTILDLLSSAIVIQAIEEAWIDSLPHDDLLRHEEGGWIYGNLSTGAISTRRAPAGNQATLNLNAPPVIINCVIVGTFHTHPNPTAQGWQPGPSITDTESAWFLGVPCLIRADDGLHSTGPDSRRGGLQGEPGFPV